MNKLQDSLRRRDIYVARSERWGDPRAKLLQGQDWHTNRVQVYRSLGHPLNAGEAVNALAHLRDEGETLNEDDESQLSPLRHAHINMLSHYTFTLAEQVTKGQLRPLKQAEESDEWPL